MKKFNLLGSIVLSGVMIVAVIVCDKNGCVSGSTIAGVFLGLTIPWIIHSFEDLMDTTNWKESQRKLKRGGYIKDSTIVRISFAYLFRIKVGNKYLLIKNERGTGKYQPVGGVYKFKSREKSFLKNRFHVMDDDKISIDESSKDDYRLRMENKYLRKFVKRFDRTTNRENIDDLSREFIEELVNTGLIDWNRITYRYCGRHLTELKFGEHFQTYELLLADIVELIPTVQQEKELQQLAIQHDGRLYFASVEEIKALGINTNSQKLTETIGDHTIKILQESEPALLKNNSSGKCYTVDLLIC